MFNPGIGFAFRLRMLTGINQQHVSHALCALFLQQGVKLFTAVTEIDVAAVTQCNHAITQIGLKTQLVFDQLPREQHVVPNQV